MKPWTGRLHFDGNRFAETAALIRRKERRPMWQVLAQSYLALALLGLLYLAPRFGLLLYRELRIMVAQWRIGRMQREAQADAQHQWQMAKQRRGR